MRNTIVRTLSAALLCSLLLACAPGAGTPSAAELEIGDLKIDGRLSRHLLKGALCDTLFAVICGFGHCIRKILAHLRAWLAQIITAVLDLIRSMQYRRDSYANARPSCSG